ncbi:MAG: hypothetical protein ACLTXM_09230 [Enterococcus sp.]
MYKITQVTLKNGIHVKINVNSFEDHLKIKEALKESDEPLVDVLETCSIRSEDVSLIEYYEVDNKEETSNEN